MPTIDELYRTAPARYPELRGQTAIVTGSSRGIGAGIAARLAREGMRVVVTGLDKKEVEGAVNALQGAGADVIGVSGDLGNEGHIRTLFERTLKAYGTVNVLVNNAADLRRVRAEELTTALIDEQFATNTRAPLLCALCAIPLMRKAGRGSIVNISSVGGIHAHLPGLPYGMTKAALDAMTRALAVDLGEYGIRVNGVAPGWTPANVTWEKQGDYLREISGRLPLRRPGTAQDIASAVAFLASDDSTYMTGQTLYVDGGMTIQLHTTDQPI